MDDNVLKFFSGKGRSGRINYVLTQYLRWNLGEKTDIGFNDVTDRNRITSACNVVGEQLGTDSFEYKIMMMIREMIE